LLGLDNTYNITDSGSLELNSPFNVATAVVDGTTYLFVAGVIDSGVSVFSVANDGSLTNKYNVTDDGTLQLDGATSVTTAIVDGTTYLFVTGASDDGVSVFSVANDGTLTHKYSVTDNGALQLKQAWSATTAIVDGTTYLFVAGRHDDGVSVFSVANDGSLTNKYNVTDSETLQLDSAESITTADVDGTTYLFVAGRNDGGVSVFSVANDGSLTNKYNVTDSETLQLSSAESITTADVGGTTYLFVAGNYDHGVSVFSVANNGALTNVYNVTDDGSLQLDGASSVKTAEVHGTTYLFVAGAVDDGVSAFSVANDGALTNLYNVTDSETLQLDSAESITTANVDGTTYLFVAGRNDDGVSVFSIGRLNFTALEDTQSDVDFYQLELDDDDGDTLTVTIAASAGSFAASSDSGVTIGGSGTASLTLSGTAADINTYLDTASNIQYTGELNANGDDAATFTINVDDGTTNPE
ncbi:lactonase family protein, partial [Puniceicoccaceae bacterium K14]|nr:lactonase family protein [Puniceicoccaceae bacterium K14]